jgi:sugar phosphate isomerase/epimerase
MIAPNHLLPLHRVGVCSWSLRATSPADLIAKVTACGVRNVQLHLDPVRSLEWRADAVGDGFRNAGLTIVSGMMSMKDEDYSSLESIKISGGIRPDSTWETNLRNAEGNAILAARLGLSLVTFHAGFLPHEPGNAERLTMVDRLVAVAEAFGQRRIRVALETGQENAKTLLGVLEEVNAKTSSHARVGVNFDPANMILYGMGDPVEAATLLAPHILQVHVKDANPSDSLGEWGVEMPAGRGSVRWDAFLDTLAKGGFRGHFVIEREAGETRVEDVVTARTLITGA